MAAARSADKLLERAREVGSQRWIDFLAPVPDRLRDAGLAELWVVTQRTRAARPAAVGTSYRRR